MLQTLVDLGTVELFGRDIPLRIYGYGLMLVLGFLLGIYLARRRARRAGESPDDVTHCGLLALLGGIVGSRAAYVMQHWQSQFARDPDRLSAVLNVTSGGLIYYGGVVLGMAMVLVYLRAKRLPARRFLDIVAVSMMVGLAFGRAGCLLNGCCYGGPCRQDWRLGMRFGMFSQPLYKLDDAGGPFSGGADGPSPVYAHQMARGRVRPDARLCMQGGQYVLPPRSLHGPLENDQMAVMLGPKAEAQKYFAMLAGLDGRVEHAEWREGLGRGDGFLRGSEAWDDAIRFDGNRDGALNFAEAWHYLSTRRAEIIARFDTDGNGQLDARQRGGANEYLQADLYALAAAERAEPVQPAQVLGIINALLLAGLLAAFYRIRTREGQVFALMFVLYPITRFVLEAIRDDNPHSLLDGVLTHNQYTSLAMAAAGVVMYLALRRFPASAGPGLARRAGSEKQQTQ